MVVNPVKGNERAVEVEVACYGRCLTRYRKDGGGRVRASVRFVVLQVDGNASGRSAFVAELVE